ncbi:MAG: hypothetical protein EBY23_05960 [Actinobacteria bacterium]|nr:hypothetical protein [Actinomycetota bacterium]
MKITPRGITLAATTAALLAISACGGSDTPDQKDVPVSTFQKNAALSFTTLPATTAPKTITTPLPAIGGGIRPTTTVANATTTSVVKTVTTPMPSLPKK